MLYLLASDPDTPFPDVELAETEPNGLLALGGDLSPTRLFNAYRSGIFPWYNEEQPLLWWSPNPRMVLYPQLIKVSRSLRKTINKRRLSATFDHAFVDVIKACAAPRKDGAGTWLNHQMIEAYIELHDIGAAHSVEIWKGEELVGGLYGVSMGKVFFGESMFSRETDASKLALLHLANCLQHWGFKMIDCQVYSPHLESLGAIEIKRTSFCKNLNRWCDVSNNSIDWKRIPRQFPQLKGAVPL